MDFKLNFGHEKVLYVRLLKMVHKEDERGESYLFDFFKTEVDMESDHSVHGGIVTHQDRNSIEEVLHHALCCYAPSMVFQPKHVERLGGVC